jgi:ribonuclease P protein component
MLKKDFRLRKQKDFDRVFGNKGRFFSQDFLALKIIPNSLPFSRFGFIVSNKVSKRAVRRNRTKRLLRECVRLSWKEIYPGFDAVMIAKSDISDRKLEEVSMIVDKLLKKSGLLVKS